MPRIDWTPINAAMYELDLSVAGMIYRTRSKSGLWNRDKEAFLTTGGASINYFFSQVLPPECCIRPPGWKRLFRLAGTEFVSPVPDVALHMLFEIANTQDSSEADWMLMRGEHEKYARYIEQAFRDLLGQPVEEIHALVAVHMLRKSG